MLDKLQKDQLIGDAVSRLSVLREMHSGITATQFTKAVSDIVVSVKQMGADSVFIQYIDFCLGHNKKSAIEIQTRHPERECFFRTLVFRNGNCETTYKMGI